MRVIQLVESFDYGDGIGNDIIHIHEMLDALGIKNRIYSNWVNERVAHYTKRIEKYKPRKDDLIIFHFSGKSHIMDQMRFYSCKKVLRYHNITPPEFFRKSNPELYQNCMEGLKQLQDYIPLFDAFLPESSFNREDLITYGALPNRITAIPILVDFDQLERKTVDVSLQNELKEQSYILFVGRVVPNKCFEDILDAFECYYKYHDNTKKLYLVGNTECDAVYMKKITEKLKTLDSRGNIVFTGKVSESQLYTYYRNASLFLCMSEHEGFCIPLLEAMHFQVPVVGYDSCAVPSTMGNSGALLHKKDPCWAACLLEELLVDDDLRNEILIAQEKNLDAYRRNTIQKQLHEYIKKWEAQ